MSRCPKCQKYLKNVSALVNGAEEIIEVTGQCKTHGEVKTNDWEYWDFYPMQDQPTPQSDNQKEQGE